MTSDFGIFKTKLPCGFKAGGINCGVRLYRPDLGVIISASPAVTVGTFTQNRCKAASVKYCEELLPSTEIRAILTNSGEANAATGTAGKKSNFEMANALAHTLNCATNQVLTASTGVIGKTLSLSKITAAIPTLVNKTSDIAENFATAILTTDLVPKAIYKDLQLTQGKIRITGICKGSGMIHPNMATVLAYLLTDAVIPTDEAQNMLKKVCDKSFNMISVDGETSTNDSTFFMANGASKVQLINPVDHALFYTTLMDIAITLAKSIARDGEGASRLIEATVNGAETQAQAQKIAKAIITSPLIKTAIFGGSANWGRVIACIGNTQISELMINSCAITIQGVTLFEKGAPVENVDSLALKEKLNCDHITITVRFFQGNNSAVAWGCDLSEKYIKINAEYV